MATTAPRRVLRSQTRTNRSARFNHLLEVSCALSEDKDTKDKLETAEILSLLGMTRASAAPARVPATEPARGQPTTLLAPLQTQVAPLPVIQQQQQQQPRTLQPMMGQRIAPMATRMHPLAGVPVLPAPQQVSTTQGRRNSVSILPPIAEGEKKRKRSKTTPEQLSILMEEFQREPMPNATTRQTLAARLGMTPRSVQVWFQNMRAKVKKTNAAASGSAPGESKKTELDDGPAKKRQKTSSEEKPDNAQEKPQSRRNSITGPVNASAQKATILQQPSTVPSLSQPVVIAISPQTVFQPAAQTPANTPRHTDQNAKLPLPSLVQHGQPILSVPLQLQFIPQSYHCDQIKRVMPAIAAHLAGSVQQQQMMA